MFTRPAFRIALTYVLFAGLWIVFSDQATYAVFGGTRWLTVVQTIKGWAFVLLTGTLLYALMWRTLHQIQVIALEDPLVELPNRLGFMTQLSERCHSRAAHNKRFALCIIDLDNFADINDLHGHTHGDQLLLSIGRQLQQELKDDWYVARIGGDEFGLLSPLDLSEKDTESVLQSIQSGLMQRIGPPSLSGQTLSLGTSWYPAHGITAKDLMRHADMALINAKRRGRNAHKVYNDRLQNELVERLSMLADLEQACIKKTFSLVYQPKWHTNQKCWASAEVLLRWRDDNRGFVSPEVFIPLAEREGLIHSITEFVVTQTFAELKQAGITRALLPKIAINLSHAVLVDRQAMLNLSTMIEKAGDDMPEVIWEITETASMDNLDITLSVMKAWQEKGVTFSIDDFGTGYSSLARLKQIPLSELKIDRSFITHLPDDKNDAVITETILAMARTLSLEVVAEGVETEAQAQWLTERGCDILQGYYFARPAPISEFGRIAMDNTRPSSIPDESRPSWTRH